MVCGYHCVKLPQRGTKIVYQPLEHMQAIEYKRPSISDTGCVKYIERVLKESREDSQEVRLTVQITIQLSGLCKRKSFLLIKSDFEGKVKTS